MLTLDANARMDSPNIAQTEYWLVLDGLVQLGVDHLQVRLTSGDLAILRQGSRRQLGSAMGARVSLARE